MAALIAATTAMPAVCASSLDVSLGSLHYLSLSAESNVTGEASAQWKHAFDADASGQVSADELGVAISALEYAVAHPETSVVEVYFRIQAIENASSTLEFTGDGRANLSAFVVAKADLFRFR